MMLCLRTKGWKRSNLTPHSGAPLVELAGNPPSRVLGKAVHREVSEEGFC